MQLAFDQVSFTYDASLARTEKKRAKKAAKQRGAASNTNTEAAGAGACAPASIASVAGAAEAAGAAPSRTAYTDWGNSPDNRWALQNISFTVNEGDFLGIAGHTGSGKSTLASLMMGYYPLTHGEIRIDGRPLASLSHSALRRGIAMVQQDPVVLADTFYANVALGRDISEAQVWEALEAVQLAAVARSMSDGLYTQLGEQGNNLSVGQKQLLALARVLVDTPQVLILDEATANIDSGTEQAIQQALAKVRQHTTLVVIAHRLSTIVEADTILVLHRGQAVERGTHQQLLAAKGRYWQMYQLQLAGEELAASAREESLSA